MVGEAAEMLLDGTLCEGCGEYMGDSCGYPRRCAGCDEEPDDSQPVNYKPPRDVPCPYPECERKFRSREAAGQHWVDSHG